jgi:hypothetical protein
MLKSRERSSLFKKHPPSMNQQPIYHLTDNFSEQSRIKQGYETT